MKRLAIYLLGVILLSSLALGILSLVTTDADAAPCAKCHLVWDQIDKVWWCIGSPQDCCCSAIKPPVQ
ncbi:MAG: hypothetical protein JSV88_11005 [Candidatus Aminicenantes bacterium]|nr:MAG: hypothetical protein JSV88_11005 [Candidatus Aminicenantes bacterium]